MNRKFLHYENILNKVHLNRDPLMVRQLIGGMCVLLLLFPLPILAQESQTALSDEDQGEQSVSVEENSTLVESDGRPLSNDSKAVFSFGLVVLGLLLWVIMQGYRRLQRDKQLAQQLRQERQHLLSRIAELDDRYARGIVQEPVYQQERPPLKQRLLEVTIQGFRRNVLEHQHIK